MVQVIAGASFSPYRSLVLGVLLLLLHALSTKRSATLSIAVLSPRMPCSDLRSDFSNDVASQKDTNT